MHCNIHMHQHVFYIQHVCAYFSCNLRHCGHNVCVVAKNKILALLLLITPACTHNDMRKLFVDRPDAYSKIFGEFDYTKKQQESAKHKIGLEYKKPVYTTSDQSKMYYVGGSVYHNYDVFSGVTFMNGFAHVGMEF